MTDDPLFDLIHALTPAEKRYVQVYLARFVSDKKNHSALLFDVYASFHSYDEAMLRQNLAPQVSPRYLSAEKGALYRAILISMRIFHDQRSVDSRIRELLIDAEYLFDKRLYSQSIERINLAKELAVQFERRPAILEILRMEADIYKEKREKNLEELLRQNHEEQRKTLVIMAEEANVRMDRDLALLGIRTQFFKQDFTEGKEVSPAESMRDFEGKSFNYTSDKLSALAFTLVQQARLQDAARIYQALMELWERHPHRATTDRMSYKRMLSNAINTLQLLKEHETVAGLIAKLDAVACLNAEEEAEQFQVVMFARLHLYMNSGQWDNLQPLIARIEDGLKYYRTKINRARELAFRCNIAICWMMQEDWKKALVWINTIIDSPKTELRRDIQQLARILRLVFYYELNQHDLLEYELINTERFLRQRKAWTNYESGIIRLMKKLIETDEPGKKGLLRNFGGVLDKLNEKDSGRNYPAFTEIRIWLQHRLSDRPIRELITDESSS